MLRDYARLIAHWVYIFFLVGTPNLPAQSPLLPDLANVSYGPHERNVLDIWFADTTHSTPMAIYIHGGGFVSGSKDKLNPKVIARYLEAGIAVAAINYRFLKHAPLPAAHHDALRALQYIRYHAEAWHIDKSRIAVFGGSAGAQLSMWLAFSDEMADPKATDPVARESSRVYCVATSGGQTTMDMALWRAWIPGFEKTRYTNEQLYGDKTEEERQQLIESISAYSLATADDPPIWMGYGMPPEEALPENPKKVNGWHLHHVNFGINLKEKMDKLGVEVDLKYPSASPVYQDKVEFIKAKLLE